MWLGFSVTIRPGACDFAAELHRQFRMVINLAWYAALFPKVKWAKDTGLEIVTTLVAQVIEFDGIVLINALAIGRWR